MEHKDYTEIHPGTKVTRSILNNLGSPDDALKIIHIAGTNGKGSTAEYFTQILIAACKKVGTFTSPAVYDFYDQFRIDGEPLPAVVIEKYFGRALAASDGLKPTDFEIQTAGVLLAFKEEGCEWAVIECGMGGLNDATNAINKKELAVITSLAVDHTQYLGDTIEEICAQKAGIIKNCPVVIDGDQSSRAAKYLHENTNGYFVDGVTPVGVNYLGGKIFTYRDKKYYLPVAGGEVQIYNAATAIEGATLLGLPEKAIREGIESAKPRGRIEKFEADGRTYIFDGGHNAHALNALFDFCCLYSIRHSGGLTLVFGCLKDKDIEGNLCALMTLTDSIIAVKCPNPRARTAEEVAEFCKKYFANVSTAQSVAEALDKASTETVVVCGSFTLLKEAKLWIDKRQ